MYSVSDWPIATVRRTGQATRVDGYRDIPGEPQPR